MFEPEMHSEKHRHGIRNPRRGIRNPQREMRNPRLSWITLHEAVT